MTTAPTPAQKTLLVGSLAAAKGGEYQAAVQDLEAQSSVLETEMVDRITDMGTCLCSRSI